MHRGANVVSLDVLESRVTTERYRNVVESAHAAHFSIFRVNGDANCESIAATTPTLPERKQLARYLMRS